MLVKSFFNVASVVAMQELFVIDDLLSALVGIEGRYISIKKVCGKDGYVIFQIDSSMDLALQVIHESVRSHLKRRMICFAFNWSSFIGNDSSILPLMWEFCAGEPFCGVQVTFQEWSGQPCSGCSSKGIPTGKISIHKKKIKQCLYALSTNAFVVVVVVLVCSIERWSS